MAAIDPDGRLVAVLDETRPTARAKVVFAAVRGRGLSLVPEPSDVRSGTATTVVAVQRWYGLDDIPADLGPTVVTLGNFDGVHRGHREVLTRVVREAAERGRTSRRRDLRAAPDRRALPRPRAGGGHVAGAAPRRPRRRSGLAAVLVLEFTREFAQQTPEEFVRGTFVEALGACAVVVGKDTRFGVRNSGDVDTLRELGAAHGFEVIALEDIGEGASDGARWSSTQLRAELLAGNVDHAAADPRPPAPRHRHRRARRPPRARARLPDGEPLAGPRGPRARRRGVCRVARPSRPPRGGPGPRAARRRLGRDQPDLRRPPAPGRGLRPRPHRPRPLRRARRGGVRLAPAADPEVRAIDALVEQMAQDVARCREILSAIVPS